MKVWEMIMTKRDEKTEIEVRDIGTWAVLYETDSDKPLPQGVGERDVRRIEALGEDYGSYWITVYA